MRKNCERDHICVACYNIFHALKIHKYGGLCPVHRFRVENC